MSEYPTHVLVFYAVGLQATVWVSVYAVLFTADLTIRRILRARRRRNA